MFTSFFFFNDTATTEIYTLSLHDALPICLLEAGVDALPHPGQGLAFAAQRQAAVGLLQAAELLHRAPEAVNADRKSTRLNSSHGYISYAVFCLKKKKKQYADVSQQTITHD